MALETTRLPNDVARKLRTEFLAWLADRVSEINGRLADTMTAMAGDAPTRDASPPGSAALLAILRDAHNIKGTAGSFGFPTVSVIAHRLEDYIDATETISTETLSNIGTYTEKMLHIARQAGEPPEEMCRAILRDLPTPAGSLAQQTTRTALVVANSRLAAVLIRSELERAGFQVVTADSAIEAFALAVQLRPDLSLISATMPVLSGVDLALALTAMPATAELDVCIVSSLDPDHPSLAMLPAAIRVIQYGPTLIADLGSLLRHHRENTTLKLSPRRSISA